mmetsp:Transcript_42757/g.84336  ORF Transcript_42757/g.84336 Transcript_42757/m.84336 type:complete len:214 (-) Transcript_42757:598-1239(-)
MRLAIEHPQERERERAVPERDKMKEPTGDKGTERHIGRPRRPGEKKKNPARFIPNDTCTCGTSIVCRWQTSFLALRERPSVYSRGDSAIKRPTHAARRRGKQKSYFFGVWKSFPFFCANKNALLLTFAVLHGCMFCLPPAFCMSGPRRATVVVAEERVPEGRCKIDAKKKQQRGGKRPVSAPIAPLPSGPMSNIICAPTELPFFTLCPSGLLP